MKRRSRRPAREKTRIGDREKHSLGQPINMISGQTLVSDDGAPGGGYKHRPPRRQCGAEGIEEDVSRNVLDVVLSLTGEYI